MLKAFFLAAFALGVSVAMSGQTYYGIQANQQIKGCQKVKINPKNGQTEYFEFEPTFTKGMASEPELLKTTLGLKKNYYFKRTEELKDPKGNKHIKYQLTYNNIPVEGLTYTTHYKNNKLSSASGKVINAEQTTINPTVTKADAIKLAINSMASSHYVWDDDETLYPDADLVYVPLSDNLILCYKVDVYSLQPLQREFVYINAQNGQVEKRVSRINDADANGTAVTKYNGTVAITTNSANNMYYLQESARGSGVATYNMNNGSSYSSASTFTDADNTWDQTNQQTACDAHFGAEKTYDYFFYKFNRNSIDNKGLALNCYVHYQSNYDNAFWDGEKMTFGDGDGVNSTALTCIDIVGHEIAHGLTTCTANLEYEYESGALNESFSDIFGLCIDFYANPSTANYLLGEQINLTGAPLRSIENPQSLGDPDTYKGKYWVTGSSDNGGVHTNSSVQNYWFYLLCEGGSGTNDLGTNYIVNRIGMASAEAIAYRTLVVYLSQYCDYEDARFYSIQAAIDLFGACSQEVISVTNAWNAVGVGDVFSDAVIANFNADRTYSCSVPTSIQFNNLSKNASGYEWYVNNQSVSTLENPSLPFDIAGIYSVKLISTGSTGCTGADTLIRNDFIIVQSNGEPVTAVSKPTSTYGGSGGIYSVSFDDIRHSSGSAGEGYSDYCCETKATVTEGKRYPVTVYTGDQTRQDVYLWIDINNDGAFSDNTELVFKSTNKTLHTGEFIIPEVTAHDVPLRMRIGSERTGYSTLLNGSSNSQYGQYEDYTLFVEQNNEIPEAEFSFSPTVASANEVITFTDKSQNIPAQWSWSFDQGTPSTSTSKNPQVVFGSTGKHNVQLTVTNAQGSATTTQEIEVVNEYILGTHTSSNANNGRLYDSGGANGNYKSNENYQFLISPACAKTITLSFNAFQLESCCDYFKIYDGTTTSAPLLGSFNGSTVPGNIKSSSGNMLIVFSSDGSSTYSGFSVSWVIEVRGGGNNVVADFVAPIQTIPYNYPFTVTDRSENEPFQWIWNFGDGQQSTEQNPVHQYAKSGSHTVSLNVNNCISSDTISKSVNVYAPPTISVNTDTIVYNLVSGESLSSHLEVSNNAGGPLVFHGKIVDTKQNPTTSHINGVEKTAKGFVTKSTPVFDGSEKRQLIRYQDKTYSLSQEYSGLDVGFVGCYNYHPDIINELTSRGAKCVNLTSSNLQTSLDTLDVLICDDNSQQLINRFSTNIISWIEAGGLITLEGDESSTYYNPLLANSGITYVNSSCFYGNATILNHEVTNAISSFLIGSSAMCSLTCKAPSTPILLDSYGSIFAAVSQLGNGKILALGDEAFCEPNMSGHLSLFFNTINWGTTGNSNSWITVNHNEVTVTSGNADSLKYSINTTGLLQGTYLANVMVASNDSINDEITFPIKVNLTGIEKISTDLDSIWFRKVFVNLVDTVQLTVKNIGTRDLHISDITCSNSAFTVTYNVGVIKPRESAQVTIRFSPGMNQIYDETLTINTSDPVDPHFTMRMIGNAVLPPIIDIAAEVVQNLYTDETSDVKLTIANSTGGSPLAIDSIFVENFTTQQGLLSDSNYVDMSSCRIQFINGASNAMNRLISYGAKVTSSSYIDTLNNQNDVIYLNENAYLNNSYINYLKRWVKAGKSLYIEYMDVSPYIEGLINDMGIKSISSYNKSDSTTNIEPHAVTHGLKVYKSNYRYAALQLSGNAHPIIKDANGAILTAVSQYGFGKVFVCVGRPLYYLSDPSQFKLGLNAMRWLGNKNGWLWVSNYPKDSIAVGHSAALDLRFDAQGLLEGSYSAKVRITTNDPATPEVNVTAKLNVTGIPKMSFVSDKLDFGLVYNNTIKQDSILFYNSGSKNLVVGSLTTTDTEFGVSETGFTLAPRQSIVLHVNYAPVSTGTKTGYLVLSDKEAGIKDSLLLTGVCTNPPVMNLTPKQIDLILKPDTTHQETVTIDNSQGGSDLLFDIDIAYKDPQKTASENIELTDILANLNTDYLKITSLIPNYYAFTEGATGYYINDGGNDMYDSGNCISTNSGSYINYSDNAIIGSTNFGTGGKYFTRKYNGLFVMAADVSNIPQFNITGGLGADSNGNVDGTVLTCARHGKTYKGFVKRVYNVTEPSVNHLVIIEDNGSATHSFGSDTNYDDHRIANLQGTTRIYYLLYAGTSGGYINNAQTQKIMETFLETVGIQSGWVTPDKYKGTVPAGETMSLNLDITTVDLAEGDYKANLFFYTNIPDSERDTVAINLVVNNNSVPYIANPIGNKVIYTTYNDEIDLNDVFDDPEGDQLSFTVSSTDKNVAFPTLNAGSKLMLNPLTNGYATIVVEAKDIYHNPVSYSFDILVKSNSIPQIAKTIANITLTTANADEIIDLSEYFMDADGDQLTYSAAVSKDSISDIAIGGNFLMAELVANGKIIVTVTATDNKGGHAKQSFIVTANITILSVNDITNSNGVLFPNPAKNNAYIKLNRPAEIRSLTLANMNGEQFNIRYLIKTSDVIELDISNLACGLYYVTIETDKDKSIFKLVKN